MVAQCKWDWCRESFEDSSELCSHVMMEHVSAARRMKKEDWLLYVRAQQGEGNTASIIPSIPSSYIPAVLSSPTQAPSTNTPSQSHHIKPSNLSPASPPHPPGRKRSRSQHSSTSADEIEMQLTQSLDPELINRDGTQSPPPSSPITFPTPPPPSARRAKRYHAGSIHFDSAVGHAGRAKNNNNNHNKHSLPNSMQPSSQPEYDGGMHGWRERNSSLFDSIQPLSRSANSHRAAVGVNGSQPSQSQYQTYNWSPPQLQTQAPLIDQSFTDESQY